eukprot:SAG31_NODE_2984_length_4824_cov_183.057143_4_plen_351_part_00
MSGGRQLHVVRLPAAHTLRSVALPALQRSASGTVVAASRVKALGPAKVKALEAHGVTFPGEQKGSGSRHGGGARGRAAMGEGMAAFVAAALGSDDDVDGQKMPYRAPPRGQDASGMFRNGVPLGIVPATKGEQPEEPCKQCMQPSLKARHTCGRRSAWVSNSQNRPQVKFSQHGAGSSTGGGDPNCKQCMNPGLKEKHTCKRAKTRPGSVPGQRKPNRDSQADEGGLDSSKAASGAPASLLGYPGIGSGAAALAAVTAAAAANGRWLGTEIVKYSASNGSIGYDPSVGEKYDPAAAAAAAITANVDFIGGALAHHALATDGAFALRRMMTEIEIKTSVAQLAKTVMATEV